MWGCVTIWNEDMPLLNNIPYYISRHSFERTDFIKWLEICSKWKKDTFQVGKRKNSDELKETKRICFVCVSRAKRVCVLMHSNIYHEFEKDKHYHPSRYLLALKHKFDTTTQLYKCLIVINK